MGELEHVLPPVDDLDLSAGGVEKLDNVARVEPAVVEAGLGGGLVLEVAVDHQVGLDEQLASGVGAVRGVIAELGNVEELPFHVLVNAPVGSHTTHLWGEDQDGTNGGDRIELRRKRNMMRRMVRRMSRTRIRNTTHQ